MSLALRRFHLEGIGPPGARFDPLTVDLTAAGRGDETDERAARTALLFLENGGGKTVLLRLIFSVVLPGRRATLAGGRLDGYVQSGDTAHVVLEWDTPDGRGLVTGTVLEWRNRTRSSSQANLLQAWYSFVPGPDLGLATLPFREGERRVTRSGFRERLAALSRANPALDLVVEDGPGAWSEHLLRATPLDPEAFRYQRQMNADEGDAESLFSGVRTDDDFVRFVIEAVHDPDELGEFAELVAQYAGQLGRREQLELEERFCSRAAAALRPLGQAAADQHGAQAALGARQAEASALRDGLLAREHSERQAAKAAHEAAEAAAGEADRLDRQAKQVSDVASELRRLEAEFRLRAAEEAEERARAEAEEAALHAAAWRVAPTLVQAAELERRLAGLLDAQEAVERDLEPLRRRAEGAAGRFAGGLLAAAAALEAEAEAAAAEARAHDEAAAGDERAGADATGRAGAAQARAQAKRERVAEAALMVDELRAEGLVDRSEDVLLARVRWNESALGSQAGLDACRAARWSLDAELRGLGDEALGFKQRVMEVDSEAARLGSELRRWRELADLIVSHPRTQALVPGADDAWLVADVLEGRLDESLAADTSEARRLGDERARLEHAIESLDADGLLPSPADVRAVRDALVDAGIAATTGWQYLARNLDEEERGAALARNPAAAGGVLVSDRARFDEAVRAVADSGVETDNVVVVGTAEDLERDAPGVAAPVRRAFYDPEWTARTRQRFEEELTEVEARLVGIRERLTLDEPLLGQVRTLRRDCPPARRAEVEDGLARLEEGRRDSASALAAVEVRAAAVRVDLGRVTADEPALEQSARGDWERAHLVGAAAERWTEAERLEAEAAFDEDEARDLRADAAARAASARRWRADAEQARRQATDRGREATGLRDEAARLGVVPSEPPAGSALEALRADADAARSAYEAERDGRDLTPQIKSVESELQARRSVLASEHQDTVEAARALAPAAAGLDAPARRARQDEAERAARARRDAHADRTAERGRAAELLEQRSPSGRPRHAVLPADEEPPDADTAARWAAERQAEFQVLTGRARELQAAAADRRQAGQAAETNAHLLNSALALLPAPQDGAGADGAPPVAPWDGEPQQAAEAARLVRERLDRAESAVGQAERALERAGHEVRAVARDADAVSIGGIRLALAEEAIETLAARSLSLADELDGVRRSVESELADVRRHREGLIVRFSTLVDTHLRLLGRLKPLSTLPPGLGEWSGQPFLTVQFQPAEPGEVPARLAPVVDAAAADARQRQPVTLLLAGMRAAAARGAQEGERSFRVRLLRPNRTMQLVWAGVAELDREFSGGMKLTAAICTYCALAALRANTRSSGRLFGHEPGPLFLDNPVGKASADYLLDLQQAVAERLRVQLVHTTGVWDVEALATYERVVRLRNLADLRRNVHRLRVDDLAPLVPASETGVDSVAVTVHRARG